MSNTKLCTYCGRRLALTSFRRKYKDKEVRHSQCEDCHRVERRERARLQRQNAAASYATDVVAAKRDVNKVIALTAGIVAQMKDVDGVVKAYHDAFQEAKRAGRHYTVFRLLQATMDLMVVSEQLQRERAEAMSDKELHETAAFQALQLLQQDAE